MSSSAIAAVVEVQHTKYHHESLLKTAKRYLLKPRSQELLIRSALLVCIWLLAFSVRLFSVLRYESVIHEFDPYFNYRSTIKLVTEGAYEFWNWFDAESWHPLGRVVGGTVYPGLMFTAAAMYKILAWLTAWVKLRDVCVFTAPIFAGNTAVVAYLYGCHLRNRGTGLIAAAFMSLVPGYMSRSVAGSFDNEAVAIFALLLTFYLWTRAVHQGTVASGIFCAFAYLYMAASWGAYVFISNLIPLYVILMIAINRYSTRLYVAYTSLWAVGSLLAMQVRFIGFNHVVSTELLAWNGVFVGLQALELVLFIRSKVGDKMFRSLLALLASGILAAGGGVIALLLLTGKLNPWTGRFWTLLDPTYAKKFIPIIASVSEHQPTTWSAYYFDLHGLVFLAPLGLYYCFKDLNDSNIFLITFALTAIYFSGIMVRLMLVSAPAFVLLGAMGLSGILTSYSKDIRTPAPEVTAAVEEPKQSKKSASSKVRKAGGDKGGLLDNYWPFALGLIFCTSLGILSYNLHGIWAASEAYSSPSIVLISGRGAHRQVLDDFREAYYWLRHNTAQDAKIMSWCVT